MLRLGQSTAFTSVVLVFFMDYFFILSTSIPRGKTAAFTDIRIRTMNEVISGMRIIKMYAWEQPFTELVNENRK